MKTEFIAAVAGALFVIASFGLGYLVGTKLHQCPQHCAEYKPINLQPPRIMQV